MLTGLFEAVTLAKKHYTVEVLLNAGRALTPIRDAWSGWEPPTLPVVGATTGSGSDLTGSFVLSSGYSTTLLEIDILRDLRSATGMVFLDVPTCSKKLIINALPQAKILSAGGSNGH